MTLNELKASAGYKSITSYNKTFNDIYDAFADGIYEEDGVYYRNFYVTVNNVSYILKVKMLVVETSSGLKVSSYSVIKRFDTAEVFSQAYQGMGLYLGDKKSEELEKFQTAINNDTEIKNKVEQLKAGGAWDDEGLLGEYNLLTDKQNLFNITIGSNTYNFLDLVYDFINTTYSNPGSKYSYEEINRQPGPYYIIPTIQNNGDSVVAALLADNKFTMTGVTPDALYNTLNGLLSLDTPEMNVIKNSDAVRIIINSSRYPGDVRIILCGHTLRDKNVNVNNDGSISAIVTFMQCAQFINGEVSYYNKGVSGYSATYSTVLQKTCDRFGTDQEASLLPTAVIDMLCYGGELKPYTIIGPAPIKGTPRPSRYPGWDNTISDPMDDEEDPEPEPPRRGDPDPEDDVDPVPPINEPEPTPEDEEAGDTSESDEADNKGVLGHIYDLGDDDFNLNKLGEFLYEPLNFSRITQIWKNDPTHAIASLHYLYVQPSIAEGDYPEVCLGNVGTDIWAPEVNKRYKQFDCGFRSVERLFKDARDYDIAITLYLPFSGFHSLDPNLVMDSRVYVKGCVDVISGDILYRLEVDRKGSDGKYMVDKKVLYNFTGNCKVDIPYSSSSLNGGGIGNVITSAITGNVVGAVGGALNAASGGLYSSNTSGGLNGNTGAMGFKYPYFIFEYPKAVDIVEYGRLFGYPSSKTVKVKNVSGYAEFSNVHIDTIKNASDVEKNEIDRILKSGVIL